MCIRSSTAGGSVLISYETAHVSAFKLPMSKVRVSAEVSSVDTLSSDTLSIDFPPSQIAAIQTVTRFLPSVGFGLGRGYGFTLLFGNGV